MIFYIINLFISFDKYVQKIYAFSNAFPMLLQNKVGMKSWIDQRKYYGKVI